MRGKLKGEEIEVNGIQSRTVELKEKGFLKTDVRGFTKF